MPIRAENRARYPKNWTSEIVPRIRARSGNRCECTGQCGVPHIDEVGERRCDREHGDTGYIDFGGNWRIAPASEVGKPFGEYGERVVRTVLTVMHLNHQPEDCSDGNLLHGCQACHLRYDAPRKHAEMKARRRAQRAARDLFCKEVADGN